MFGKNIKPTNDYEEKINAAKYDCIHQALKDILKIDVKAISNGKEETNFVSTCSAMKTRARLALEFVANLEKDNDDK